MWTEVTEKKNLLSLYYIAHHTRAKVKHMLYNP